MLFLFGMPRSGTSWVGKIFDSHPSTIYRHEPDSVTPLNHIPLILKPDQFRTYQTDLEKLIGRIKTFPDEKVSASLPIFRKDYFNLIQYLIYKTSSYASKIQRRFVRRHLLNPIIWITEKPENMIVWKSIESLGRLSELCQHVPNSQGIVLLRHPCGHVNSVIQGEDKGSFDEKNTVANDTQLYRLLFEQSGFDQYSFADYEQMNRAERIALRWLLITESTLRSCKNLDRVMVVKYEDICRRPMEMTRKMFDFANLKMSDQTAAFIKDSISHNDESYYAVKKDPLVAAYKWKTSLKDEDIAAVRRLVDGTIAGGYYSDDY